MFAYCNVSRRTYRDSSPRVIVLIVRQLPQSNSLLDSIIVASLHLPLIPPTVVFDVHGWAPKGGVGSRPSGHMPVSAPQGTACGSTFVRCPPPYLCVARACTAMLAPALGCCNGGHWGTEGGYPPAHHSPLNYPTQHQHAPKHTPGGGCSTPTRGA